MLLVRFYELDHQIEFIVLTDVDRFWGNSILKFMTSAYRLTNEDDFARKQIEFMYPHAKICL